MNKDIRLLDVKDSGYLEEFTKEIKRKTPNLRIQDIELNVVETPEYQSSKHIYFINHYYDLLSYLHNRKERTAQFKQLARESNLSKEQYEKEWKQYCQMESFYLRKSRVRTSPNHFQILAKIGQGGYGQVFLARKTDTKEICALKKMNKKTLASMNEVDHIVTERDILVQTKSQWLVRLLYAFHDPENIYLAMEYVPGGDLRTLLNNSGILLEQNAKFYIAEMFASVNELHQLGYIHRDLKPENFLIDRTGHIKLTDFGLSKGNLSVSKMESLKFRLERIQDLQLKPHNSNERKLFYSPKIQENSIRAFSLVGSPDYMAPEILTHSNYISKTGVYGSGYDFLVDYWALGCILFEFLAGFPPFAAPTPDEVWVNLYYWQEVLERPVYEGTDAEFNLTDEAWDLITKLLTHRHVRLASITDVQTHQWFSSLNTAIIESIHPSTAPSPAAIHKRAIGRSVATKNQHIRTESQSNLSLSCLWNNLRTCSEKASNNGESSQRSPIQPPFIPKLANETDHCNFDDFSNPDSENMAIYKEIHEKQAQLQESVNNNDSGERSNSNSKKPFIGFTYKHSDCILWREIEREFQNQEEIEISIPSKIRGLKSLLKFNR